MVYDKEGKVTSFPNPRVGGPQWVKDKVSKVDFNRTKQVYELLRKCEEYNKEK